MRHTESARSICNLASTPPLIPSTDVRLLSEQVKPSLTAKGRELLDVGGNNAADDNNPSFNFDGTLAVELYINLGMDATGARWRRRAFRKDNIGIQRYVGALNLGSNLETGLV